MKTILLSVAALLLSTTLMTSCNNAKAQDIELPTPDQTHSASVMEALSNRRSVRSYTDQALSDQELSTLLWAANGISREDGKRTAPSAVNAQDIDIYVCKSDGAYLYVPAENKLQRVSDTDMRPVLADHNKFIETVPLVLLMVSDQAKFERFGERGMVFGAMDAAYVSENICLYCAAKGLATVPCSPRIDVERVQQELHLTERQIPFIYHPVGYAAE